MSGNRPSQMGRPRGSVSFNLGKQAPHKTILVSGDSIEDGAAVGTVRWDGSATARLKTNGSQEGFNGGGGGGEDGHLEPEASGDSTLLRSPSTGADQTRRGPGPLSKFLPPRVIVSAIVILFFMCVTS